MESKPFISCLVLSVILVGGGMLFGLSNAEEDVPPDASSPRITPTVRAVGKVLPSVVNISTVEIIRVREADVIAAMYERWFGRHHPDPRHYRRYNIKNRSLGSGVLVDAHGLVITNDHVIQRATKIIVTLADGSNYEAIPKASFKQHDLALIQLQLPQAAGVMGLEPMTNARAIEFAIPGDLILGEPVITVGNPFGLRGSVTTGILSAWGRTVILDDEVVFDDLIQTDAAINPGNSGGPLVNANGELIGINLAIHLDEHGVAAEGISYAISSKLVEEVLSTWLIPSRFGDNLCGIIPGTRLEDERRCWAIVKEVLGDSPAAAAGLEAGDVILEFNGVPVRRAVEVGRLMWHLTAGDPVRIKLENGGTVKFEVGRIAPLSGAELIEKWLQAEVEELTPRLALAMGLDGWRGLVISRVLPKSVLGRKQIERGDIVRQVGEIPISRFADVVQALKDARHGDVVRVAFLRPIYLGPGDPPQYLYPFSIEILY